VMWFGLGRHGFWAWYAWYLLALFVIGGTAVLVS